MGLSTRGISQKTRIKRCLSAIGRPSSSGLTKLPSDMDQRKMKGTDHGGLSPTVAPFNSTSFLIRQKPQQRDQEEAPGALDEYGSNLDDMIICCPFTPNPDCPHQSQAPRPIDLQDDVSLLHLQLQRLQVIDSSSDMEVDDSPTALESGHSGFKLRRVPSFTDDNFEMFD